MLDRHCERSEGIRRRIRLDCRFALLLAMTVTGCTRQPAITPGGIVSNNPCIDAILAEIATPGQIGAVSIYSHGADSASAPLKWARKLPALGTSAEEIIAAKPRLVLTGNLASSGTNAALAKAAVKTIAFGVPANVEDSIAQIRQVAAAIGQPVAGEALVRRIERAATPAPASAPAFIRSAIIWQNGAFVAGKGTLQDSLLTRAGYRNASDTYGLQQWDILPLETLIRKPPDVIFMPLSGKGEDARALAARRRVLAHVTGKVRIVNFPDKLLFCGGPTIIKVMEVLR
jgi:iron complex transport system substrate-binding protein